VTALSHAYSTNGNDPHVGGVSNYERSLIDPLLQRHDRPIEPGTGLALFDANANQQAAYTIAVGPAMRLAGLNGVDASVCFTDLSRLACIVDALLIAQAIVIDISGLSASVFYVLGLAHALGRCPILISSVGDASLPFDLAGLRCLRYRNHHKALIELREDLSRALRVFLASSESDPYSDTT